MTYAAVILVIFFIAMACPICYHPRSLVWPKQTKDFKLTHSHFTQ
jgi:hypothetical protein